MAGVELVSYEYSSVGPIEHSRVRTKGGSANIRRASIRKRVVRASSLPTFVEIFTMMYGAESEKRAAIHRESRTKIGRRMRIGRSQMTLFALMAKSRCNGHVTAGIHCAETITTLATLIWKLSLKLAAPRTTYAACRVFAPVFIGAVMDIMTRGMNGKAGCNYIPKLGIAAMHRLPPEAIKALGISCRNISRMSRAIRKRVRQSENPSWTAAAAQIEPAC